MSIAYGTDAGGSSEAAEIIATPDFDNTGFKYHKLIAYCVTKAALLSIDGGDNFNIYLPPSTLLVLENLQIKGAVQAKNATASQAYVALHISVIAV